MEASVRYIHPPTSGPIPDGGFKPAICFRAREYAHCVVNEDSGIHVIKVPVRDFDRAPVVMQRGEAYPPKQAAKYMLDCTTRVTSRRDITLKAAALLQGVLDGSISEDAIDAPAAPVDHWKPKNQTLTTDGKEIPTRTPTTLVATICAELKIDPPVARKLLRKAGLNAPYTDEAQIRAILKKEI